MERLTPAKNFPEKKTTFESFLLFPLLSKRPEISVPFVCTTITRLRFEDSGIGRHIYLYQDYYGVSQIDSQLERIIPSLISSVGNVQCHLSKTSHRKFRLNGKRPCFCTFSGRNRGSFSEQRLVIEGSSCAAVFSLPAPNVVPLFFHAAES